KREVNQSARISQFSLPCLSLGVDLMAPRPVSIGSDSSSSAGLAKDEVGCGSFFAWPWFLPAWCWADGLAISRAGTLAEGGIFRHSRHGQPRLWEDAAMHDHGRKPRPQAQIDRRRFIAAAAATLFAGAARSTPVFAQP